MDHRLSRRSVVAALMGSAAAMGAGAVLPTRLAAAEAGGVTIGDGTLSIAFDSMMRARVDFAGKPLTAAGGGAALRLMNGTLVDRFLLLDHKVVKTDAGEEHRFRATASGGIEQQTEVVFDPAFPGMARIAIRYRNTGTEPLMIAGWRALTFDVLEAPGGAWTFAGASYPNRRDWVQPVAPGFQQRNYMGMNGSDYGGGTPVAVVWRRDAGLAVGHLETVPKLVALPVAAQPGGTRIGVEGDQATVLDAGDFLSLPEMFVMAHRGDHFAPLDAYRRVMAGRGLAAPKIPDSSYGAIWCAWGYERDFTTDQVYGTLPKAKALGFEWAVLDDGWQTNEGDWEVDRKKFPRGGADMKAFADRIKADGMRPRLWLAPLAADPGSKVLKDHPDMLLLGEDGAAQNVSWWSAFTMCPAYQPVIDHFRGIVRQIVGEWGYEGIKLDGQHLNGVAPCYNPAHNHARPEESYEKLQDFWKALYDEALAANPQAIMEICPCGDSFAFHNIPAMNNTPASDPESSWQVRHKGKTFKALMGPSAPYSGDHVELSDTHDDFASSYGIGAIPSTKFTWPEDAKVHLDKLPPGGFVLTAEKEKLWGKWIALYNEHRLPQGTYLGGLYDIGFDKPEGHVVEKNGALHYAFFAETWDGPIALRGLGKRRYTLTDGFTGAPLGTASGDTSIPAKFEKFLLVRAVPA